VGNSQGKGEEKPKKVPLRLKKLLNRNAFQEGKKHNAISKRTKGATPPREAHHIAWGGKLPEKRIRALEDQEGGGPVSV